MIEEYLALAGPGRVWKTLVLNKSAGKIAQDIEIPSKAQVTSFARTAATKVRQMTNTNA